MNSHALLLRAGLLAALVSVPLAAAAPADDDEKNAQVYELKQLDRTPTPRSQAKPIYPFELRRKGVAGEAVVAFVVGKDGYVRAAYAVSATHEEFGKAAAEAVSKWRFRPGMKDDRMVDVRMQVPIVFAID